VRAAMSGVDALAHAILSELRGEETAAGSKKDKTQLAEVK
jgi:hypothetical protein